MDDIILEHEFYCFLGSNLNLINSKQLSDVCFLVGQNQKKIYAHQQNLALGSPIFYKMFYGDKKKKRYKTIEEPNLSRTGFLIMIRHIYGDCINNDLSLDEIFEAYIAADKYLVHGLTRILSDFIKMKLAHTNFIIIYDLLIKIKSFGLQTDLLPIDIVENLIKSDSDSVFSSGHFLNISQFTLIELLKIDNLKTKEIDILKSCLNWINEELKRKNLAPNLSNKQLIFDRFKNLIDYSKLTIKEIEEFKEINELFNISDIGKLFLTIINKSDLYGLNFSKKANDNLMQFSAISKVESYFKNFKTTEFVIKLKVNKEVLIECINTFLPINAKEIKIYENLDLLNLNFELFWDDDNTNEDNENSELKYIVKENLILKPDNDYRLVLKLPYSICFSSYGRYLDSNRNIAKNLNSSYLDEFRIEYTKLSKDKELKVEMNGDEIIFNLEFENFHCIKSIEFSIWSNQIHEF